MPITSWACDRFVTPESSRIKSDPFPELPNSAEGHSDWLANFILNSMFRVDLEDRQRALRFSAIRKTQAALAEYSEASSSLSRYVGQSGRPIDCLFDSLRHTENCVLQAYQAFQLARMATGVKLFSVGDNSPLDRLRLLSNSVRHCDERLADGEAPSGATTPVWISDEAVCSLRASLMYTELTALLDTLCTIAQSVSASDASAPKSL